ncbi:MAG TPA: hypothetical protein VGI28_03460 [Stellaceae bacterium]
MVEFADYERRLAEMQETLKQHRAGMVHRPPDAFHTRARALGTLIGDPDG